MKKIVFLLSIFFLFAIEPSYIKDAVSEEASKQLAEFVSFNVTIMQEPYGAKEIKQEDIEIVSLEIKPGITMVDVAVKEGRKTKTVRYLAKITIFDDVLILKESALRHRDFDLGITEGRFTDVTALYDAGKKWVKSSQSLDGKRFVRTVRKDSILLEEVLENKPDVLKDAVLSVSIADGGVELTCDVVALEEGFIGDTIEVMHSKYKKKLQAIIKANGIVEIKG